MEKAIFAAGCFWGVQTAFDPVKGVTKTTVGYTGGNVKNPTYEQVCTGKTGHAEACLVEFDPSKVGYRDLLAAFWKMHDPTTPNRQGPDIGNQYRSAVFYLSPAQAQEAKGVRDQLDKSGQFEDKIVTEITAAGEFYPAEEYHQKYFEKHGGQSCHVV
jgi:peptide-methionine (S)-S-oxide reductase